MKSINIGIQSESFSFLNLKYSTCTVLMEKYTYATMIISFVANYYEKNCLCALLGYFGKNANYKYTVHACMSAQRLNSDQEESLGITMDGSNSELVILEYYSQNCGTNETRT